MGCSWPRKRPTVATTGRFRQIVKLVMVMVVVMHVVVIHVVMVGMPGVMRFGRDRRESNRPGERQRGDDSL